MPQLRSDRPIPAGSARALRECRMDRLYWEPETLERAFTGATYVVGAWEDETGWCMPGSRR